MGWVLLSHMGKGLKEKLDRRLGLLERGRWDPQYLNSVFELVSRGDTTQEARKQQEEVPLPWTKKKILKDNITGSQTVSTDRFSGMTISQGAQVLPIVW